MKILVWPLLLILMPITLLFFITKHWTKRKAIPIGLKVVLGIIFITIGVLTSFYAMSTSMEGMAEKKVKCMTGVVAFIPFGLLIYIVGVPLLLSLSKKSFKTLIN